MNRSGWLGERAARALVLLGLGSVGCMGGGHARAVQLYEGTPDESAVLLVGDVLSVDGKEVPPRSRTFALLPGCHKVTNVTYWIGNDANAAMTVRLPERAYWMNMKEGHQYELRIGTTSNSDTAQVVIKALERDKNGDVTRRFEPGSGCE